MSKTIIALGFAAALIMLGFGGCVYLCDKGDAERSAAERSNPSATTSGPGSALRVPHAPL